MEIYHALRSDNKILGDKIFLLIILGYHIGVLGERTTSDGHTSGVVVKV